MPDDTLLRAVMVKLFADRQLSRWTEARYRLRAPPDQPFLSRRRSDAVETLDREALQQGRPANEPLAAEVLPQGIIMARSGAGGRPLGHPARS